MIVHKTAMGACLKIPYKGYEISIAFDDGTLQYSNILNRSDMRIYKDDKNVTAEIYQDEALEDIYQVDWNDVTTAMALIDQHLKG